MGATIGGAVSGIVGGLLGQQKEGGTDAKNFLLNQKDIAHYQDVQNQGLTNIQNANNTNATSDVQNNAILGGMFGQGGTLQQTQQQEQQQANQPWQMTPEDQSMYGQMSGDIARQFGQSDQSMAQALASRGLSNSGVAGASFSGSQGNKMEQLAKAQQSIAQQRFQNNLTRLGQTQQFLGQLGNQAQGAIGQAFGQRMSQGQAEMQGAGTVLGNFQNQANENLQQQQQTQHQSGLSAAFNGAMQGAMGGAMSGGGGGGAGKMAGQSSLFAGGIG